MLVQNSIPNGIIAPYQQPETMFSLANQTAIVTGAATGIGEAIAIRLAGAGARVACWT